MKIIPKRLFTESHLRLGLALALFMLVLIVFWPATGYDFVNFDDDVYVSNNLVVQRGLTWWGVRWAFTTVLENWWLPALWISYMVDVELFGSGAFGFHFTNVMLHAVNVVLLFWILCRCTGARWPSFFVAAFFAFHPLRVESVAWISERKDVLSGLFFFLAWLAYLRYVERPGAVRFGAVFALMLLGLLSKAILIVLPFLFLLLDYWPLRRAGDPGDRATWPTWRRLLAEKIPLFFLSAIFITINLHTHVSATGARASVSLWLRLGLIAPNYYAYLGKIFWPARLSIVYPPHDVVSVAMALIAGGGLLAITFFCWHRRAAAPWNLVGWLWFLGVLFPMIRGVRMDMTAAYADRFTYLPSIGLGIALVWTAKDLWPRRRACRVVLISLAAALLAVCISQTRATLPSWRDTLAAFGNILKHAPDHPLSNNNFGVYLMELGQTERARQHFEIAATGNELHTPFVSNLGLVLILLDRPDEAIQRMESVRLKFKPECEYLNYVTGLAWMEKNEPAKAIPYFTRALMVASNHPTWRAELARAYRDAGQMAAYSNELAHIANIGFLNLASYEGLCIYYLGLWQHGHGRRAWTFFQRELERNPDDMAMLNNTAWFLATRLPAGASPEQAIRLAIRAREASPAPYPDVLDTLAVAYAANGQFDDAIHTAEEAQALALAAGNQPLAARIEERLQAYRSGMAWGPSGPVKP